LCKLPLIRVIFNRNLGDYYAIRSSMLSRFHPALVKSALLQKTTSLFYPSTRQVVVVSHTDQSITFFITRNDIVPSTCQRPHQKPDGQLHETCIHTHAHSRLGACLSIPPALQRRGYLGCRHNAPSQPVQPTHPIPDSHRYPPMRNQIQNARAQSIVASHR